MKWTSEPPTEPGWYWNSWGIPTPDPDMLLVERRADGRLHASDIWDTSSDGLEWGLLVSFGSYWAGPIPHPEGE